MRFEIVALAFMLMVSVSSALAGGTHEETVWHDATEFEIEGKGWADTESPYDRLPSRAKGSVPESVWGLGKQSAGLCVRFTTNSRTVSVRWELTSDNLAMPHMPATGVSGVDLYKRAPDGTWRFVQNGRPTQRVGNQTTASLSANGSAPTECLLYLPLYNGVKQVEIGVGSGAVLTKGAARPEAKQRPIVYYGTSIAQGGCASRPGNAHVAMLGRMLDRPMINLGFSGSGKMEPSVSAFLAELDPAAYVIDCLWNIGSVPESDLTSRVTTLVQSVRKAHPTTPILFVGQSLVHSQQAPSQMEKMQSKIVNELSRKGVPGLSVCPGKALLGADEDGTVDGVHPNDLGFRRHADALAPILTRILHETVVSRTKEQ